MLTSPSSLAHCDFCQAKALTLKAKEPTLGTARPSASVDETSTVTGSPASRAAVKLGHVSDSTAIISTSGRRVLTASAMPAEAKVLY